jgi:polysaccharide chain length determinant protein (PEP-CTERM system associated)
MDAATTLTTYLRMALRKRWWLLVPLVACTSFSVVLLRYLPRTYRASTVVLVEPQSVPAQYVKPLVTVSIEEAVKTIRQQVTSRTRLEQVARDLILYPASDDPRLLERRVADMRSRIDLDVKQDRSFTLSYRHGDPVVAAQVTNRLAELFIEASNRGRQRQAEETSAFLADELERTRQRLTEQEAAIAEFKRDHQAELPTQQDANLRNLEGLHRQLRDSQLTLERSRDRKALLEAQMSGLSPFDVVAGQADPEDPRVQLVKLRKEVADLRLRYTDRYPEVQRLQERIAELQKEVTALPETGEAPPGLLANPAYDRLRSEIQTIELEIAHLEAEQTGIREEIVAYQKRVENAPRREQELLSLTRDYDTWKQNYQQLLHKHTDAELAETLERERQGEQFVILDRALPPAVPYRPDPVQVIGAGFLLGLAIGVAIVALQEMMCPTFYSPKQVQESLGVPVVAAVPLIRTARRRASGEARR